MGRGELAKCCPYVSAQARDQVLKYWVAQYSTTIYRLSGSKLVPSMIGRCSEGPTVVLLKAALLPIRFLKVWRNGGGRLQLTTAVSNLLGHLPNP